MYAGTPHSRHHGKDQPHAAQTAPPTLCQLSPARNKCCTNSAHSSVCAHTSSIAWGSKVGTCRNRPWDKEGRKERTGVVGPVATRRHLQSTTPHATNHGQWRHLQQAALCATPPRGTAPRPATHIWPRTGIKHKPAGLGTSTAHRPSNNAQERQAMCGLLRQGMQDDVLGHDTTAMPAQRRHLS